MQSNLSSKTTQGKDPKWYLFTGVFVIWISLLDEIKCGLYPQVVFFTRGLYRMFDCTMIEILPTLSSVLLLLTVVKKFILAEFMDYWCMWDQWKGIYETKQIRKFVDSVLVQYWKCKVPLMLLQLDIYTSKQYIFWSMPNPRVHMFIHRNLTAVFSY